MNKVKFGANGWKGWGDQVLIFRYSYLFNLSLLLGLEPSEKFLVVGGWWCVNPF